MGGRRARTLTEIVGTGLSPQERRFTRAVGDKDAEAVAASSANLVAKSGKISDIIYYASKLADFVRRTVESGKDLNYEERKELARKEWSRVKKKENLPNDPIVTNAIVSATAKAIGKETAKTADDKSSEEPETGGRK